MPAATAYNLNIIYPASARSLQSCFLTWAQEPSSHQGFPTWPLLAPSECTFQNTQTLPLSHLLTQHKRHGRLSSHRFVFTVHLKDADRASTCQFTPQMPTMAGAGEAEARSHTWLWDPHTRALLPPRM